MTGDTWSENEKLESILNTSILNGQPVVLQNGCNMCILSMICNNMSKGILNTLQFVLIET